MRVTSLALAGAAAFTLSACVAEHHHYHDEANAHPHDAMHPAAGPKAHPHAHPQPGTRYYYHEPRDVNKYEVFCPPKQAEMGQC